jgi:hypothetical protein
MMAVSLSRESRLRIKAHGLISKGEELRTAWDAELDQLLETTTADIERRRSDFHADADRLIAEGRKMLASIKTP